MGELNNPPLFWARAPHELAFSNCGTRKSFNNQGTGGITRRLFNDPMWHGNNGFFVEEIGTVAQDKIWTQKNL